MFQKILSIVAPRWDRGAKRTDPASAPAGPRGDFSQALFEAACTGLISDGLLQQGYHSQRSVIAEKRSALLEREGNLKDQLAAIEAELAALGETPPPEVPEPTILRVLPFGRR